MGVNEFLELPTVKGKSIREKTKTYESPKSFEVLKITSSTKFDEYLLEGRIKDPAAKHNRIYSSDIEKYEFVVSLGIKDVTGKDEYKMNATFYKGGLIFIGTRSANREFERILTEKYGKPVIDDKSKIEICQNGYGAKSEHINGSIDHYWGRGKAVEAKYYIGNFSCGKYPYSGYQVYSPKENLQVDSIQAEGIRRLELEETKNNVGASKL